MRGRSKLVWLTGTIPLKKHSRSPLTFAKCRNPGVRHSLRCRCRGGLPFRCTGTDCEARLLRHLGAGSGRPIVPNERCHRRVRSIRVDMAGRSRLPTSVSELFRYGCGIPKSGVGHIPVNLAWSTPGGCGGVRHYTAPRRSRKSPCSAALPYITAPAGPAPRERLKAATTSDFRDWRQPCRRGHRHSAWGGLYRRSRRCAGLRA
jgi:hypothetical protein